MQQQQSSSLSGQSIGQQGQGMGPGQTCKHSQSHKLLDLEDAALILIDHQTGLFNLVRDIDVADLQTNVQSLARAAYLSKIPVVVTTSKQDSFHGPLVGELEKIIPDAFLVKRDGGEINAWDCREFVNTIEKLNKKTLIMAGTLTNVCLALPAIAASFAGYRVYVVIDASGASSKAACKLAVARMSMAHIIVTDTLSIVSELMGTFNRKDKEEWFHVFGEVVPRFKLLIDTFRCAEQMDQSQGNVGYGRSSERYQGQQQGRGMESRGRDQDTYGSSWKQQQEEYGSGGRQQWGGQDREFKETRLSENRKFGK
jgi:nicotinamidase-related amidase